jgi:hypothetical protein
MCMRNRAGVNMRGGVDMSKNVNVDDGNGDGMSVRMKVSHGDCVDMGMDVDVSVDEAGGMGVSVSKRVSDRRGCLRRGLRRRGREHGQGRAVNRNAGEENKVSRRRRHPRGAAVQTHMKCIATLRLDLLYPLYQVEFSI